ncbi:hypothetical protein AMJ80_07945 [bacterium SM23_31]|nr:MAG: hypothetical protein AMJ80_07945 [bacterium SM23_31]
MKSNKTDFEKDHWFFITTSIINHNHILHKKENAIIVLNSLNYFVRNKKLHIGAFVIMSNHIHYIAKPRNEHRLSDINRDFKKFTAQQIIFRMQDNHDNTLEKFIVNKKDRKLQIWKRGSNIKNIYSRDFMIQKIEYIHNNPCQIHWNIAHSPENYEYSSASFYIKNEPSKYIELFDLRKIL